MISRNAATLKTRNEPSRASSERELAAPRRFQLADSSAASAVGASSVASFDPVAVSYTHLTLPTSDIGYISVVALSLKKKMITRTSHTHLLTTSQIYMRSGSRAAFLRPVKEASRTAWLCHHRTLMLAYTLATR